LLQKGRLMDLFSHSNFSINRHFQRSIRIDNETSKEFLEHFIFSLNFIIKII